MNYLIKQSDIEILTSCPVCKKTEFRKISEVGFENTIFFETVFCNSCGLVFRKKRPSLDWFIKNWALRDDSQIKTGFSSINEKIEEERYERYKNTAVFFKKIFKDRKLVDVGTGTGTGMKAFQDEGFEVIGIEPDSSRARIGKERYNLDIIECTVDNHELEQNSFEIVTCIHSLEHFHYPYNIMESAISLVKDGGYIYIEVPDFCNFVTNWHDSLFLGHLNNFSENNLILLGASLGLKPLIRAYPKSTPYGIKHLGILFQRDKHYTKQIDSYTYNEGVQKQSEHSKNVYIQDLPENNQELLSFKVPEINDISLTYKASQFTNKSIKYNYLQKSVEFSPKNKCFIIKEPTDTNHMKIKEMEEKDANLEKEKFGKIDEEYVSIPYQKI